MNKYRRKISKEIKSMVRNDKWERLNYKRAKRIWRFHKRFDTFRPCEDCDAFRCTRPKTVIAYCPNRK